MIGPRAISIRYQVPCRREDGVWRVTSHKDAQLFCCTYWQGLQDFMLAGHDAMPENDSVGPMYNGYHCTLLTGGGYLARHGRALGLVGTRYQVALLGALLDHSYHAATIICIIIYSIIQYMFY